MFIPNPEQDVCHYKLRTVRMANRNLDATLNSNVNLHPSPFNRKLHSPHLLCTSLQINEDAILDL